MKENLSLAELLFHKINKKDGVALLDVTDAAFFPIPGSCRP
jgi:hypothetical protein